MPAINLSCPRYQIGPMDQIPNPRSTKPQIFRFGDREIVTEGLHLNFWADISHRCMTASWPSFIAGAVVVFLVFNAIFGLLYWLGDQPISNVPGAAYIDYLYFSIETLSTAGYGDMHPQTHYGHFIATTELFTGIFSMSLMTGLIFARFSRPNARLLFAAHPVISVYDGKPTLMIRFANERHNMISSATVRLWIFRNEASQEGHSFRRFSELALIQNETPVLALIWTIFHVIDENSPFYGLSTEQLSASTANLIVLVSGYDEVAAQTMHGRKIYFVKDIRHGHRYANIASATESRVKIDYGRFHETQQE
jgi:inward rectifier potassium channel